MSRGNSYDDVTRAQAYARLEFPGTYYLAFRDLPDIIAANVTGRRGLDFGCGAGRSTAFLKRLGFEVVGIDISPSMIELARKADPGGSYQLIEEGEFGGLPAGGFDLILSAFAFDNIPDAAGRVRVLCGLRELLCRGGRIIVLGSTPEVYTHEWASFTTRQFAANRTARSGDAVQIVIKDVADQRPVTDYLWSHEDYLRLFSAAQLEVLNCHKPLGRHEEPQRWEAELTTAPWVIYVLRRSQSASRAESRGGASR
jgi:SAM-dependent methyltransferase